MHTLKTTEQDISLNSQPRQKGVGYLIFFHLIHDTVGGWQKVKWHNTCNSHRGSWGTFKVIEVVAFELVLLS